MKRVTMCMVLCLAAQPGLSPCRAAAAPKVAILAYINQTSGCQVPTEEVLRRIAARHGNRVSLEFVDFGSPKGRQRWQADGLHCMAIRLNGSSQATVVSKGVTLEVAFEMPVGFRWRHAELEAAVRQMLDGVAPEDRQSPKATVQGEGNAARLLVGAETVLEDIPRTQADEAAKALNTAAAAAPLTQEAFALEAGPDGAPRICLRGDPLDLLPAPPERADAAELQRLAQERFLRLVAPFPCLTRPFPGMTVPAPRR